MKDGICAKCSKAAVYMRKDGYYGLEIPVSIVSKTFLEMYVCAACGYLEFYVQGKDRLKQIPEEFRKVG